MNKADLTQAAACGERRRMALLEALRAVPPPEKPSALLGTVMSSGQAFAAVQEVLAMQEDLPCRRTCYAGGLAMQEDLPGKPALRLWQAKVIHKSVWGQTIREVWRQSVSLCLAQAEYARMTARWQRSLALVGIQNAVPDK